MFDRYGEPSQMLVPIYELRIDEARLRSMQEATKRTDPSVGLSPEPALVGSAEWWALIETGALEVHELEGPIAAVRWGSMGDWPEFVLEDAAGDPQTFTREGDHTRYVEGLTCRVRWVLHRYKADNPNLASLTHSRLTLAIWIEESHLRSETKAPGPGAVGWR